MDNHLNLRFSNILLLAASTLLLLTGCTTQSPQGATIEVQGPANDTVQWSALQNQFAPSCSCTPPNCRTVGNVPLPSGPVGANGLVTSLPIPNVVDDSVISTIAIAGPTPCMGVPAATIPECPNPTSPFLVPCAATNPAAAQGHVTVTGSEDSTTYQKCTHWLQGGDCENWETLTAYNKGAVSLTLNGQTVSVAYGSGSTAFSLGFKLAQAIEQNSTLAADLMAAPNGPVVYLNAINTGTQYDYPWTSSCTYDNTYFDACSFTAGLSPAASLASPQ